MKHRQLSPDSGSGGGIEGFGKLTGPAFLDVEQVTPVIEPVKVEAKVEETPVEKAAEEVAAKVEPVIIPEKTAEVLAEEKKVEDAKIATDTLLAEKAKYDALSPEDKIKADDAKEKAEIEASFKIPDEEKVEGKVENLADEGELESNWLNVGKKLELSVKEDTIESFMESYNSKLNEVVTKTKADALKTSFEEQVADLPLENQILIRGLKQGLPVNDIMAPLKRIEELRALSNEELVAADLKGQGYEEDYVNMKLEKLDESGELVLVATEIRKYLSDNEVKIKQNKLDQIKELETATKNKYIADKAKETEDLRKSFNKIEKFLDTPVSEKVVNYLMKGWEAGKFHEDFKDPAVIADFLIFREFGKQGIANMKQKSYELGLYEKVNKLHEIPPIIKAPGSAAVGQEEKKEALGNWGAFENIQ